VKSLWRDDEAGAAGSDPLALRVYTSHLLGCEPSLVLHGGGNTSVKTAVTDLFGDEVDVLYVKGSGWDLATIEAAGFAPVKLDALRRMAELEDLSDSAMVAAQRAAMLDPAAPNPSVEAILHAIIPFAYVDHTHADAVVTLSNTPDGESSIRELYGERILVVPYVMPGFVLARTVHDMTRDIDWKNLDGIVLLNHGVFTFADDARESYERMIRLVSMAEDELEKRAPLAWRKSAAKENLIELARLRRAVSAWRGGAVIARTNTDKTAVAFSGLDNVAEITARGTLTPDHVIRTKPWPVVIGDNVEADVEAYAQRYHDYFARHAKGGGLTCLDAAPRWAVWAGYGCVGFGRSVKEADIINDIVAHTIPAIARAEAMGGWRPVSGHDLFDIEYWELEQAKLKKGGISPVLQGRVALVTGAASGIGKACVAALRKQGAVVAALDINADVEHMTDRNVLGIICDVTDDAALKSTVDRTVREFGGLDIVISNAGIFPVSERIAEIKTATWKKSLAVNLTSHQRLLQFASPYLELGVEPAVVIIASKNVPAPGPGAAAYSVAKAGLTQLGRVAALEMADKGVRVNMLHPDAVFDTAIWTDEVLAKRAASYGMSVAEYRKKNLLGKEVTSRHVAELACAMAGPLFARTTGAQLPVDGGNDRVI